ncbi:acylneuraminate cytidylyltransferase family protein [Photobacterium arenosum]|uniref:acylneuraminate cytidylyltransferase family protein n=1 Tax=Photobacterium arenosum TaxID=2774143 RepID=UPI00288A8692|nr:acylneuraminate cytidylyltransferase family protein [Photobacterium arenosum]
MSDKFIALITARGGSKGIPRKNIFPLNGKPLIVWTIQAALECQFIEHVFVSTDDDEIASISTEHGAEVIRRPEELASDTASSIDVVTHSVEWLEDNGFQCTNIVLLQPTSPLRTSRHLSEALQLFYDKCANFIISVFEPSHTPVKSYIQCEDGSIEGLYSNEAPYMRRQDLPRAFQPNGAIYAFSVEEYKRYNHFPRSSTFPYIMSESDSIDIDTKEDLMIAESRLKELKK